MGHLWKPIITNGICGTPYVVHPQVDYIVTPTKTICCEGPRQRPSGIQWPKVTLQMLKEIPVLRDLQEKERRLGKDVSLMEHN